MNTYPQDTEEGSMVMIDEVVGWHGGSEVRNAMSMMTTMFYMQRNGMEVQRMMLMTTRMSMQLQGTDFQNTVMIITNISL